MMPLKSDGYADLGPVMMFYQLWRAISNAFIDFVKSVLVIFGVDLGESE